MRKKNFLYNCFLQYTRFYSLFFCQIDMIESSNKTCFKEIRAPNVVSKYLQLLTLTTKNYMGRLGVFQHECVPNYGHHLKPLGIIVL